MALITDKTQIKLISKLSGTSTFNGSDLLLLQRGFKSYKFNYNDLVSALPDGSTLEASSNQLGVKDSSIDTQQLANNSVNFSKMQDIDASSTKKVIGKMSGNGDPEEVDVITNLGTASNSNIPTGLAVTSYVTNNINYIAILEESQPNGTFCDGTSLLNNTSSWHTTYDPNTYTESVNVRGTISATLRFFQRNINNIALNQNNIVSNLTSKRFTLETGIYIIKAYGYSDDHNYSQIRLKRHDQDLSYGDKYINYFVQKGQDNTRNVTYFESVITVSGTLNERTYSFEHGSNEYNANADYGYPRQLNGEDEVYFRVEITKVG